jgi:hypothetical protein
LRKRARYTTSSTDIVKIKTKLVTNQKMFLTWTINPKTQTPTIIRKKRKKKIAIRDTPKPTNNNRIETL